MPHVLPQPRRLLAAAIVGCRKRLQLLLLPPPPSQLCWTSSVLCQQKVNQGMKAPEGHNASSGYRFGHDVAP